MNGIILSDLHLDHSNISLNFKDADFVILAGDIASDKNILLDFLYKIECDGPIFFVFGNHEFDYKNVHTYINEIKKETSDIKNLHILDNEYFIYNDVKFIGSTLWTDLKLYEEAEVPLTQDKAIEFAENSISGFKYMKGRDGNFRGREMVELNKISAEYIKAETNNYDGKIVVISHFLPSKKSVPDEFQKNTFSIYYASNLEHLMDFNGYWIHGHTHHSMKYKINDVEIICNPRGYSSTFDLSENSKFQKDYKIELNEVNNNRIKVKI